MKLFKSKSYGVQELHTVMEALRYPLIVLVLYMHIVPLDPVEVPLEWSLRAVYIFLTEYISHNFGRIAVPIFFLISGFLFFRRAPERFSWTFFTEQWRKRIWTLLIPYLLWNILKYSIVLVKTYVHGCLVGGDAGLDDLRALSMLDVLYAPINEPLWYVRDLICMVLVAPLFYTLFRCVGVVGLLGLLVFYFSVLHPPIIGFSPTAIFYFGLGAYYAISQRNMLDDFCRFRWSPFLLFLLILLVGTFVDNVTMYKEYWIRPAIVLGVVGIFYVVLVVKESYPKILAFCARHAGSVFFIYAVHEIYLKSWVKGIFYRTPLAESGIGMIVGYAVMPLCLLALCHFLDGLTKRISPRGYKLFTGGRS